MAGVDLRTVQVLGEWSSLSMVQRYSHMAADHLRAAVERLVSVPSGAVEVSRKCPDVAAPRFVEALPAL
jgi:hypothetical protein